MTVHPFFRRLTGVTEGFLARRKAVKRIKKERQRAKNPIVDWIEAFIWAAGVVLLINQYLFQAYQIPSGSMISTLMEQDRIFVNKLVYGPELLPGLGKLPSPVKPKREDVIIFESPEYVSRGPVFDIAQRILYMLTLSFVDIDRDDAGAPKVHFLIKRAAGMGGDRFESRNGDLYIRFAGETRWVKESDYTAERGFTHVLSRLIQEEEYKSMQAAGEVLGYRNLAVEVPEDTAAAAAALGGYTDFFAIQRARLGVIRAANPHSENYRVRAAAFAQGWYVPEGRVLPLGDNRDNSNDGRYFGPVKLSKVLGRGSVIYWPLGRMRFIK
ncbi:MAG: signal peptidase I [Treponema sp.]|jgi:signal peptidase I|nr:signal peptidase I [Treponema sp.]